MSQPYGESLRTRFTDAVVRITSANPAQTRPMHGPSLLRLAPSLATSTSATGTM